MQVSVIGEVMDADGQMYRPVQLGWACFFDDGTVEVYDEAERQRHHLSCNDQRPLYSLEPSA